MIDNINTPELLLAEARLEDHDVQTRIIAIKDIFSKLKLLGKTQNISNEELGKMFNHYYDKTLEEIVQCDTDLQWALNLAYPEIKPYG